MRLLLALLPALVASPAIAGAEQAKGPPPADSLSSASGRWAVSGLWSRRAGRSLAVAPALFDSVLVTTATDGRVSAWRLEDGRRLWSRRFKSPIQTPAADLRGASGRTVVIATSGRGQAITALAWESGRVVWSRRIETPVTQLAGADTMLLAQEQTGRLVARSARDGSELWSWRVGGWESPPFHLDGAVIYAAARNDSVFALRLRDGQVLWRAGPGGRFLSAPVLCAGNLALTSDQGEVSWLRAEDGVLVSRTRRAEPQIAAGASLGDQLVTVSAGGVVECGGPRGNSRWRVDLESAVVASPVVAGDRVLVATTRGQLRVLETDDGRPQGVSQARAGFRVPPLIAGSRLLLADDKGNLHAYRF